MKPIHHAMVSSRLFGGNTLDYVDIHTKFDLSKSALGDMRHRAALHSVDHGGAVMAMVYRDKTWPNASTKDLVIQHVNDDQGFDVTLNDWLFEASVPTLLQMRQKLPQYDGFLEDPVGACVAKWGGTREDYTAICAYFALPMQFSNHPLAPAMSLNTFSLFFSEAIFGPALTVTVNGKARFIPTRDIGEALSLARYGRLFTLEVALSGIKKADWMLGSKVKASRRKRAGAAHNPELFVDV